MTRARSFQEYVKSKCYNELYQQAENFVNNHWDSLNLYTRKVRRIGSVELTDATIKRVYIEDLPGMTVGFDVCMELEICVHEGDYHYDESDVCYPWVRVCCEGDLSCGLDGFIVKQIVPYNKKKATISSLSDALVPNIKYDQLEKIATDFLVKYYPEALKVTRYGELPIPVNPERLAANLGLKIMRHRIRKDGSVYGQIFFADSDAELFDPDTDNTKIVHIPKNTVVVDSNTCLLRNLGCENNTIVHECIHGILHRKVFELERLYNDSAHSISCEVVGGAKSEVLQTATDIMEKQANQLAPRILMPEGPFRAKASEYIGRFMREKNTDRPNEVMEAVIIQLQSDFLVSRQAAKIRMVELGFDEAIGTFTFLDGHYVKPHGFKKGSLKWNQTFSISIQDAGLTRFLNKKLRSLTADGDYLFIDNHFVFNDPKYVEYNVYGHTDLTAYARSHMDECCLVFDMSIEGSIGSYYHTVCYLNRMETDYTIKMEWNEDCKARIPADVVKNHNACTKDIADMRKKMIDDPAKCLQALVEWCDITYDQLSRETGLNRKTIKRIDYGETIPKLGTALLICFGLHLPPAISLKFLQVCGHDIRGTNPKEVCILEALTLMYMEPVTDIRDYLKTYADYDLPDTKEAEEIIDRKKDKKLQTYGVRNM